MSSTSIFYSWQSDLPQNVTRQPIADALSKSVAALSTHPRVVDSPRLDQDVKDVSGTPEIAGTIFHKIERAAVFVADVSLSSQTTDKCSDRKYSPNVNVMIETGYAAARLGWDRIVLVMNDRFRGPSKLPFDLRNRSWPITFADPDSSDLASQLIERIGMCLAADYTRAEDAVAQLSPHARRLIRRLAHSQAFNDGTAKNEPLSRDDYHTHQMIRLGLIQCVADSTDLRSYMAWTYLGRECCRRLGVELPAETDIELDSVPNVFADNSALDSFLGSSDPEPPATS